jgi:hypothetical protein
VSWTEHDLAQLRKKPGYTVREQLGKGAANHSPGEELLMLLLDVLELEPPEREYRFAPPRRWRFDFAWPVRKLAVEVEGITYEGGRHQRIDGFEKDCEKYEAALLDGWRVYRTTAKRIRSGAAMKAITELLDQ